MPFVSRGPLQVITDSSGDATEYTDLIDGGFIYAIYINHLGPSSGYANTADITIVTEHGRIPILSLTDVPNDAAYLRYFPVAKGHDSAGAEIDWATGVKLRTPIPIANERVEITVAQGGSVKRCDFTVVIIENWWVTETTEEEE